MRVSVLVRVGFVAVCGGLVLLLRLNLHVFVVLCMVVCSRMCVCVCAVVCCCGLVLMMCGMLLTEQEHGHEQAK
jgi:hypothetical protein